VNRQQTPGRSGLRPGTGDLSVLVSAALDGVVATLSVAALHTVRPADLLAVELGAGALILLAVAAWTRRLRRRGAVRQLLLGALVPGAAFLLGDLGLARTSASSGSLLLAAEPLLSVLLAVAFLRERLQLRAALALVVGLAGSALVAFGPTADGAATAATTGNLLVLAAVTTAAVYVVATRRYSYDGDGLNASAWQTAGGALATAPFIAISWTGDGTRLDTAGAMALAACAGVLAFGMAAAVAFNHGIARIPAARAAQLLSFAPVVGTLSAVIVLGERPTPPQLAGGTAILFGLVLLLATDADTAPHAATEPAGRTVAKQPALAASTAATTNDREGAKP
jgi:drug/metabolite transporter (DMT)-like permease